MTKTGERVRIAYTVRIVVETDIYAETVEASCLATATMLTRPSKLYVSTAGDVAICSVTVVGPTPVVVW